MVSRFISSIIILSFLAITSCAVGGGSIGAYYGHRYEPDPWYYRGGLDRVHIVSEKELNALE
jgi:hypothetical protein